jgi:hypothetical protein
VTYYSTPAIKNKKFFRHGKMQANEKPQATNFQTATWSNGLRASACVSDLLLNSCIKKQEIFQAWQGM